MTERPNQRTNKIPGLTSSSRITNSSPRNRTNSSSLAPPNNSQSARAENSKSAGNSPVPSPVLSRKVLQNSSQSKCLTPYSDKLGIVSRQDGEATVKPADLTINVTDVAAPDSSEPSADNSNNLEECPCGESDKSSTYIKCAKCSQGWHNKCCNLRGTTQATIKKMEWWLCPRCFTSRHAAESEPKIDQYKLFMDKMARLEKCNEELNGSISSVEFFNQHIRHLLLDDTKFKSQSTRVSNR